jgi:hypothetical protein
MLVAADAAVLDAQRVQVAHLQTGEAHDLRTMLGSHVPGNAADLCAPFIPDAAMHLKLSRSSRKGFLMLRYAPAPSGPPPGRDVSN